MPKHSIEAGFRHNSFESREIHPRAPTRSQLLLMVVIAFSLRIFVAYFQMGDHLNPARDHWKFGWETGRLARSLASGHGYSSPLFGDTGPSAWMTPLYPLLLAAVFKLFGIYSTLSAWIAVSINCLLAAATCLPLVLATSLSFGAAAARWAGWIWVFFPYSIYLSTGRIWSHALAAFLVAMLLWLTVRLSISAKTLEWILYGLAWGAAALTEPSILTILPCFLGWLVWRRRRGKLPWLVPATVVLATTIVVICPWFARNAVVFHCFVPFRSNSWLVFWQSNTGDTSDLYPDWANPPHSDSEMTKMQRVGELAYMQEKRVQAIANVRAHPLLIAWITVRRIVFFWTGFWSLYPPYSSNEPFQIPNTLLSLCLTAGIFEGVRTTWREARSAAVPYVAVLALFPLPFYVTHPSIEYRHPIDPIIVALIGVTVFGVVSRIRNRPESGVR